MAMRRFRVVLIVAAAVGFSGLADRAVGQSEVDENVQAMMGAARSLKYSLPENSAYVLEKQETIVSDVAIIFGYADNRAACQQIAGVLTASLGAGTFKCKPVH